ncbi:MAG: hypothetical protein ABEJ02_02190 [Candidatus Paceibacteria bacterium]
MASTAAESYGSDEYLEEAGLELEINEVNDEDYPAADCDCSPDCGDCADCTSCGECNSACGDSVPLEPGSGDVKDLLE